MAEYKIDIYKIPDSAKSTAITTDKITSGEIPLSSDSTFSSLTSTSNLILSVSISKQNQNVTLKTGTNEESKDTLLSVDYLKKMYEPGWMQIKLQLGTRSSSADLKEKFSDCIVNLSVDDYMVARNYYIFQVRPEYKKESESTSCHVFLTAYSPDKFLTLDTYSRAYTCKRPFEDILGNTLVNFKDKNSFARFIGLTEKATNNLLHMKVDAGTFILPYSVQYNESFYDFLVRLANRNGEFLYWDQGQLQMGLPSSTTSTVISVYEGVTFENPTFEVGGNTTPIRSIATDKDLTDEKNETSMLNPSEVANEEYWATISKDGYVGFDDLMTAPVIVSSLIGILSEPDLFSMILSAGSKIAVTLAQNAIQGSDNKKKWNETYFSDEMKNKNSRQYNDSKEMYSPFSHYVKPEELVTQVGKGFYQDIRKGEQKMDASRMQVKCTGCYNIALGDRFTIDSDTTKIDSDTTKYVSIQIEGHVSTGNETWNLTGIPDEDYPITSSKGWVRKSEPQTAFVVSTDDPLRMGRIRIKYLWQTNAQTETDGEYDMTDASPWIRMSTPMASEESGFFFLPSKGDEVLISFENGNVERPYMTGALHNKRTMPYNGSANRTITSLNGHQIAFRDGSPTGLVGGSGLKILSTFSDMIPSLAKALNVPGGDARIMAGGITITDPLHFYTITTSTENRSVSISSPLGMVSLSAFTGIKISAPNGDIILKGKNITLDAGNKVTIKSGSNISSDGADYLKSKLLGWAKLRIKEYVVDLTLFRTLVEALIKPIDGTLRIKSQRYLCLDAGEGSAKVLDHGRFSEHKVKNLGRLFFGLGNKSEDYVKRIRNFDGCVQSCLTELANKSNAIIVAREVYHNAWNEWPSKDVFTENNWKTDVNNIVTAGRNKQSLPELAHADNYFAVDQHPPFTQQELNELRKDLWKMVTTVGDFEQCFKQQLKSIGLEEGLYNTCNDMDGFRDQVFVFDVLQHQQEAFLQDQLINPITIPVQLRRAIIQAALPTLLAGSNLQCDDEQADWDNFIASINYADQNAQGSQAMNIVAQLFGVDGFLDQYAWQGANKGDILFSSKKGTTFYLTKDKTIDSYKGSSSVLDDIKQALRDIHE
ncbi:MAG: phage baseplate assembly protein V [Parabacteroides sp.]|nr:phage baseplate assembly protein V [Parabacteroides sp.]